MSEIKMWQEYMMNLPKEALIVSIELLNEEIDELRSKLAALQKQKPTAIVCRSNDMSGVVDWVGRPVCSAGAKLYAAAGAAPVPMKRIPEMNDTVRKVLKYHGLTKVGDGVVEADLIEAVLAAAPKEQP